jgi:hypothetical protein
MRGEESKVIESERYLSSAALTLNAVLDFGVESLLSN